MGEQGIYLQYLQAAWIFRLSLGHQLGLCILACSSCYIRVKCHFPWLVTVVTLGRGQKVVHFMGLEIWGTGAPKSLCAAGKRNWECRGWSPALPQGSPAHRGVSAQGISSGGCQILWQIWSRAFWSNSPALTPEKPSLSANISPWLPLEPSSLTRNQMNRKILLHFIPLNHGQKISVAGERQRKNGERHLWILHLWWRNAGAPEFPLPRFMVTSCLLTLTLSGFDTTKQWLVPLMAPSVISNCSEVHGVTGAGWLWEGQHAFLALQKLLVVGLTQFVTLRPVSKRDLRFTSHPLFSAAKDVFQGLMSKLTDSSGNSRDH